MQAESEHEVLEGDVVEVDDPPARSPDPPGEVMTGREIEVRETRGVLFKTDDPAEILARATDVANQFKDLLRKQKMVKNIQGRDHVLAEGWQTVGMMLGVTGVTEWSRPYCDPVSGEPVISDYDVHEVVTKRDGTTTVRDYHVNGFSWEARVIAKKADGTVIAAGEAMCSRNESTWSKRDDFSLRSMAQTRASSKALRAVLGWIVTIAGYSATPGEEMPGGTEPDAAPVAASAELEAVYKSALVFVLHKPDRVEAVHQEILKMTGGVLPAPAAQGVVLMAKAIRDMRQTDNTQEGEKDGGSDSAD